MFHLFVFPGIFAKGNFVTKTTRVVTSFSSPHPPRTKETTPPSCDAASTFRRTRAVPSASAARVFVGDAKTGAHAKIVRRQKHRGGPVEKSAAFRPSSARHREFPSNARRFRHRSLHDLPRRGHDARTRFFSAISRDGFDFGEGNPQTRICPSVTSAKSSGRGKFFCRKKLFEPRKNRVCCRAIELLVRDRLHKRLKRRAALFRHERRISRVHGSGAAKPDRVA